MKKVILATVLTVGVLATSVYAYNADCPKAGQKGMQQGQSKMNQQGMKQGKMNKQGMQQGNMKCKKGMKSQSGMHRKGGKHGGMQLISQLNLSDDQRFQLSILKDEMKLNMKKAKGPKKQGKMLKFIGDNGFDKVAFQKEMNTKHQAMSLLKADHMEKVFKLLTKEQLADLKTKLAAK